MSWLKRILLNSILFLLVLFMPWYFAVIFGGWLFWKYRMYEIMFFALCMDILYGSNQLGGAAMNFTQVGVDQSNAINMTGLNDPNAGNSWFSGLLPSFLPYLTFTYGAALLILILNLIKKRIRFYA